MSEELTYFERWKNWILLEHGPRIEDSLQGIWDMYSVNRELFSKKSFYWGAGYDAQQAQYVDWDKCDLRDIDACIAWDILMGFPYDDGVLQTVKTKLSIGMMTWEQVGFVLRETARCLAVGGQCVVTFRDFNRLLARREELDPKLFVRYIYGCGHYFGSRRRSCWTPKWLSDVAERYNLRAECVDSRGMNSTVVFRRDPGLLKRFTPEPVVFRNEDGSIRNDSDDFHGSEGEAS